MKLNNKGFVPSGFLMFTWLFIGSVAVFGPLHANGYLGKPVAAYTQLPECTNKPCNVFQ